MNVRALAESVILQSLEDLQDPIWRVECMEFFHGWRFRECAELAAMDQREISLILEIVESQKKVYSAPAEPGATDTGGSAKGLILKIVPLSEEDTRRPRRTGHAY